MFAMEFHTIVTTYTYHITLKSVTLVRKKYSLLTNKKCLSAIFFQIVFLLKLITSKLFMEYFTENL